MHTAPQVPDSPHDAATTARVPREATTARVPHPHEATKTRRPPPVPSTYYVPRESDTRPDEHCVRMDPDDDELAAMMEMSDE